MFFYECFFYKKYIYFFRCNKIKLFIVVLNVKWFIYLEWWLLNLEKNCIFILKKNWVNILNIDVIIILYCVSGYNFK